MPENTVKVDQSTRWGNPYKVGDPLENAELIVIKRANLTPDQIESRIITQEVSVALFRAFLTTWSGKRLVSRAACELPEKNLACWCKPGDPCHADVWLEVLNQ